MRMTDVMYPQLIRSNHFKQMNYDGILSQFTEEKLSLFQSSPTTGQRPPPPPTTHDIIPIEEGAIEEEQAAVIKNVVQRSASRSRVCSDKSKQQSSNDNASPAPQQRKISTSQRFINAFQQLYSGSASNTSESSNESSSNVSNVNPGGIMSSSYTFGDNAIISSSSGCPTTTAPSTSHAMLNNAAVRTPTKNMETKLLTMWNNVKYGWSGKIKSNFSKDSPVWLLGRCYHRKYTPPSSMETSAEFSNSTLPTATLTASSAVSSPATAAAPSMPSFEQDEPQTHSTVNGSSGNTLLPNVSNLYPDLSLQQIDEIIVPQELGLDAAENQMNENPWEEGIEGFRRDFYSRIWMTYRREFPTMNGTSYTSDCGWGCMLRSGQMLMAQGLLCHFLGRCWRYDPESQLQSTYEDNLHKKIIKWFGDSSSKSSPFSIHALVRLGEKMGKKPGDWYGPASVSYLLKQALKNAALENADFDNITIYVARDCTIYMQDIEDLCQIPEVPTKPTVPWQMGNNQKNKQQQQQQQQQQSSSSPLKQHWKSVIVLIPLRLGTDKLNPVYAHCLKLLLSTEYCIGIIGGRPKHSLYFIGFQDDKLIHLDPHYCQEMVDVNQENFSLHSFHCKSPRKLKTSKMDPSCCIGFYCATKADYDNFVESVQLYLNPMRCASGTTSQQVPSNSYGNGGDGEPSSDFSASSSEFNYPLFSFSRGRCLDHELDEMSDSFYRPYQSQTSTSSTASDIKPECDSAAVLKISNTNPGKSNVPLHPVGCNADDDDCETEEFVLL